MLSLFEMIRLLDVNACVFVCFRCRIEIGRRAKYEMEHLLNMLRVILAEKQSKPGELNADFFLRDDFVGQRFYQYLYDLISEFEQLRFI